MNAGSDDDYSGSEDSEYEFEHEAMDEYDEELLNKYREEGNEHFKNGRDLEALASYDQAIRIKPDEVKLYTNKALVLQKLGRLQEALDMTQIAKLYDSKNLKASVIAIKCALAMDNVEVATSNYTSIPTELQSQSLVVELRDKISAAAKEKGNQAMKDGQRETAVQFYSWGIEVDPTNHILYSNRSACYQGMKRWQLAADDGQKVISLNNKFVKGHLHLIRSLIQLGLVDRARSTCVESMATLSSIPDWADQKKQFDDLLSQVDSIIAENKRRAMNSSAEEKARAERFKTRGNEMYNEEDYTGAISQYSQAIAACPMESTYYGNRAAAWLMLKEYGRVISDCEKGIELEKYPGEANKLRERKGKCLLAVGKLDDAATFLNTFLTSHEGVAGSDVLRKQLQSIEGIKKNVEMASQSLENKEYSRAKRLLTMAKDAGLTDEPRFLLLLARVQLGLEEFEDAAKSTQTVLNKLQTNSFIVVSGLNSSTVSDLQLQAYRYRADALQSQGLYDQALRHLLAAAQMDPDNAAVNAKYKAVKAFIADSERVRKGFDEAFRLKKYADAISLATEGLNVDKANKKLVSEMHLKRGRAYLMQGKAVKTSDAALSKTSFERCVQDCNRAMYYDNSLTQAFYLILDSLEAQAKYQEAIDMLEEHMEKLRRNRQEDDEAGERMKKLKKLLKAANRKNLYEIVGVEEGPDATEEQIRKAYRKSALKWHPDKHSSKSEEEKKIAEMKFKELNGAYDILSDANKRRMYDEGYDADEIDQHSNEQQHQQHHAHSNPFAHFGGRGGFHF